MYPKVLMHILTQTKSHSWNKRISPK